ncbi:hypothetical protein E5288_WYG022875 [Bos mutus]|uniref:Uncharacterized protein n=1 Tax=Bos mutus TaxID=72004 RepID=A0A6B0S8K9_9CETA|nr:hypothetical protein [Bos mutus]
MGWSAVVTIEAISGPEEHVLAQSASCHLSKRCLDSFQLIKTRRCITIVSFLKSIVKLHCYIELVKRFKTEEIVLDRNKRTRGTMSSITEEEKKCQLSKLKLGHGPDSPPKVYLKPNGNDSSMNPPAQFSLCYERMSLLLAIHLFFYGKEVCSENNIATTKCPCLKPSGELTTCFRPPPRKLKELLNRQLTQAFYSFALTLAKQNYELCGLVV